MAKKFYAIKWTNGFGNRVYYPEKVWHSKAAAERNALRLKGKRAAHGIKMRNIRIVKLK